LYYHPAFEKLLGEFCIIHAVAPKRSAVAINSTDGLSEVTKELLDVLQKATTTFPACIEEWAKNHRTVEVNIKSNNEFQLITNFPPLTLTSKIPDCVSSWTSEHLIIWLQSIKVREIDKYTNEISNCQNGYDGLWIWNRIDEPNELAELFSMKADLGDVKLALKKWINSHPQ